MKNTGEQHDKDGKTAGKSAAAVNSKQNKGGKK